MRRTFYPFFRTTSRWLALAFTCTLLLGLPARLSAAIYAGDIAILSLQNAGTDQVTFLTFQNIPAGEQLRFTDRGWQVPTQAFLAGENTVTWTAPSTIFAGSTVTVQLGNILDSGGDQILVYQGTDANPRFVTAIQAHPDAKWQATASDIHTSALPQGLVDGFTAVAPPLGARMAYDCAIHDGLIAELLVNIHNTASWVASNSGTWAPTCNFSFPPTSPTCIIGRVSDVNEADGTFTVPVYCSRQGNYSVQVNVGGGSATFGPGGDFSLIGSSTVNFSNSQVAYVTFQLHNDNICEGVENVCVNLCNPYCVVASNAGYTFSIEDDDASSVTHLQTFENDTADNWSYTTSPSPFNTQPSPDPLIIRGHEHVWQRIQSFLGGFGPSSGRHFWGFSNFYSNTPHDIEFSTVSLAGIEHASLVFKYISFNFGAGGYIEYWVSYNGSGSWNNATVVPLNGNTQAWTFVHVPVPQGAQSVRLRIRVRQGNGNVCGGIDDVCLVTSDCQPPGITLSSLPSSICASAGSISIPFTTTGSFAAGNVFTAQLSAANGSFANPTAIGSLALSGNAPFGTIQGTLPAGLPPGTGYRIRIVASSPALISPDNGFNISVSQTAFSLAPTTYPNGFQISCPGQQDGAISVTVQQGQAPFTYAWSGPGGFSSSASQLSGLAAGTYTLTLTDATGCLATASTTLSAPTLAISLQNTPISCFGAGDGTAQANVSGSNPPFTLQWSGPGGFSSTAAQLTQLQPGGYTLVVTDASGCTASQQLTLSQPASLQVNATAPLLGCGTHISCANAPDGRIDLQVQGGTSPYQYHWSGPGGFQSSTANLSNLSAGTYDLTLTDAHGCQAFASQSLTAPAPLDAAISAPLNACGHAVSCFGGSDGSILLSGITGGCPPYSVAWSNGSSSLNPTGLAAGNYTATITDAVGCSITRSISLTQPDALALSVTITDATCNISPDGAIDLSVTGGCPGYTYSWVGPGNYTSTSEDALAIRSGVYTVTVTDTMGCSTSASFTVGTLDNLSASLGCCQDTAICAGDSVLLRVDLTGTGPWFLTYHEGTVPHDVLVTATPYYIVAAPSQTTIFSITGLVHGATDCPGTVCGSATVAINNCDTTGCADLCVNAGVLSEQLIGECRTVTLEFACDTACNDKSALQSGGACLAFRSLNFDRLPDGSPLAAGTPIAQQWAALGFSISATNNTSGHPNQALIFGSDWPTGFDFDLGTPHDDFGGPGMGIGGAPGMPGQNDRARGNLLIIAEDLNDGNLDGLVDDPSDELFGGSLTLSLNAPRYIESLTLVDIDSLPAEVRLTQANGNISTHSVPALGANSISTALLQVDSVVEIRITLPGEGALAEVLYCPARGGAAFTDVSIPCGQIQSYSNNAGLPMALLQADTATGITGIRVFGLPGYCLDSTGQGPFELTYTVCDTSCGSAFCLPLVAYQRDGCIQYERAVMGSVNTPIPPIARVVPEGLASIYATPNPARGSTQVRFHTHLPAHVTIDLIDLSGRFQSQVWQGNTLADEPQSVELDTQILPAGMYFLRLRSNTGIQMTSKLLILQ